MVTRQAKVTASLRFAWSALTSMRTALILLLLLGLAAIPGSLLPQRPTNPSGVADYLRTQGSAGYWLDRFGFFDVFGSAWFTSIYLLLFISLIGCIIPRIAAFAHELRSPPNRPPGRLSRLPGHLEGSSDQPVSQVLDAAVAHLRAGGYRVRRDADAIAAQRGYLREAGNLVFHICLVTALIGLATGSLFSFRGTAIIVEGQAFSNTLTQYDEFGAGAAFDPAWLTPFTVRLDSFNVRFETGPVQRGAARAFDAQVRVEEPGRADRAASLGVNSPLSLGGDSVHLLGHGYAPIVTVKDGSGAVAFSGPVVFLPQDANFRSNGVINAPDARPVRLAFEGVFLPTAATDGASGMVSAFPDALNPELLVNVWTGPPAPETGVARSVYVLDKTGLTQLTNDDGDLVSAGLKPGTGYKLPDGKGSVTFDGWKRWTKLQVSNAPGGWLVLSSVMLGVLGMAVSLTVRPRRLYVRVHPEAGPGGEGSSESKTTTVSVAGLDQASGRGGLTEEVSALARACGIEVTLATIEEEEQR